MLKKMWRKLPRVKKKRFIITPMLTLSFRTEGFVVYRDVSRKGLSCVLM
jgi:hypothetical protein